MPFENVGFFNLIQKTGIFIVEIEIMCEFNLYSTNNYDKMLWKTIGKVMAFKIKKFPNLWK